MRIRAPKDFWSGVMFCGFAVVGLLAARGYSLGSAGKMGPGYFPLLLGLVLAGLGAILIARSIAVDGEPLARFHLPPLAVVVVAVCLFGAMIEPLGLVLLLAVLTLLSAAARPPFPPLEAIALPPPLTLLPVPISASSLGPP